jgi:16S rRNA processing protein RimM
LHSTRRSVKPNHLDASLIRVGQISGTHGLRGGLRVRLDNPDSDALENLRSLNLAVGGANQVYEVAGFQRANRGAARLTLIGVDSIEKAEALRGAEVMVPAEELPEPSDREFYYFQAIGCEVTTTGGQRIGTVEEVFSTGANDVLVVRDAGHEVLVPAIEDVVKSIDLEARTIVVEPIPGLLDPA